MNHHDLALLRHRRFSVGLELGYRPEGKEPCVQCIVA